MSRRDRSGEGEPRVAIGLMSGTSMDGIDAALLTTDGERVLSLGGVATYPYDGHFRDRLRALLGRSPGDDANGVVRRLTKLHAEAVQRLLAASGLDAAAVDVVGFHGHTVLHRPERRLTRQIGDGQLLADLLQIPVVEDFRSADVAAGGHGAPLAPLFHAAMAWSLVKPVAVLNIGGVANVTWIGEAPDGSETVMAFDTGPGNALVDDWVRRISGQQWDERGRLARGGRVREDLVSAWLDDPYFRAPPPKSLDRDSYAAVLDSVTGLSAEDGAATLTAFTALSVAAGRAFLPAAPTRWLICGGGRRNGTMMAMLAEILEAPVEPVEAVGWDGDGLEAQAFAFLAVRSLNGLPLSLPSTTGVPSPTRGGVLRTPGRSILRHDAGAEAPAQAAGARARSR
ncbi:MAG: anhydro-N-acetylmuramic acid kinase [Rhodospirillales bacterium]|nr:MAG: anhydro-N-acetylmuramic acid kinase [Rhodospirillales bacterium]